MLKFQEISPFVFDCNTCQTPCNGVSKMSYLFENDASFSESYEQKLISFINTNTSYTAKKTEEPGYPDIEVKHKSGSVFYIELKVQRRTFMGVEKIIPNSGLKPSETIALNLSDLLRYFKLEKTENLTIFIFWVVLNRPCITANDKEKYYYRLVSELKPIYLAANDKRKFKRKSGEGDVVNGLHKGVTLNYHFSLCELKPWKRQL